jgi:hypothetical protein
MLKTEGHIDVALIVGCYKQEKYVKQALWSARNQIVPYNAPRLARLPSYQVIESHDNCEGIGTGAAAHRNRAIAKIQKEADWIIWLDADDLLSSTHLYYMWQAMLSMQDESKRQYIYAAPVQFISGCRLDRFPYLEINGELWPFGMSAMFAMEVWYRNGGFNKKMPNMQDWDFWLRCGRTIPVPQALMLKRDFPMSNLKTKSEEDRKFVLKIFEEVHHLKLDSIFYPYFVPQTDVI